MWKLKFEMPTNKWPFRLLSFYFIIDIQRILWIESKFTKKLDTLPKTHYYLNLIRL